MARSPLELRPVKISTDFLDHPAGSVLMELGLTRVLCCVSVTSGVPPFLENRGQGWLTAEYAMLPAATHSRKTRESTQGKVSGRTHEIQRLIGRSLRAICDLKRIPEFTVAIDCDVLQADGGTRTAAITGTYVALELACRRLVAQGEIPASPVIGQVAAISVGMKDKKCYLDLDYQLDSNCDVDMNVVMTADGKFIEIQGTAEGSPFSRDEQNKMIDSATEGIKQLMLKQRQALESVRR